MVNNERAVGAAAELLGPLERRVMERLWVAGPQSVSEVVEALNAGRTRNLAYTTVMTVLVRLFEKGYVARERELRHYRYEAAFNESSLEAQVGRRELGRLIDRYGIDSVAGFAADLVALESPLVEGLRSLVALRKRGG